jgi:periplasmic protein TonB
MFTDSLLDSPWDNRYGRGWSMIASFAVQAAIVGSLLVLPLIYTSGLPRFAVLVSSPVVAPSSAPLAATHSRATSTPGTHEHAIGIMVAPPSVPRTIEPGDGTTVPAAPDLGSVGAPYGSDERASGNGVGHGTGSGFDVAAPPPPPPVAQPRVSRMMEGNLIYRVQPDYPSLARLARIQGAVVLRAVISKQGTIENLQAISGPPMLMKAAVDAVQRWRYRPYLLNGESVEVDTEITVNFVLSAG